MAVGVVIYYKARAFKAQGQKLKARAENPKTKAKKFGLKAKAKD